MEAVFDLFMPKRHLVSMYLQEGSEGSLEISRKVKELHILLESDACFVFDKSQSQGQFSNLYRSLGMENPR